MFTKRFYGVPIVGLLLFMMMGFVVNQTVTFGQTATPSPSATPSPTTTPVASGVITGVVMDATTSTGIGGAKVETDLGGYVAVTQPDGSFAMEAAPGTYQVKASADGYEASTQSATVTSGAPTQVVFQLQPKGPIATGNIYGAVDTLDEEGDSMVLEGVTVTIEGAGYSNSATTDEDGLYQFSDLAPGDYKLTFELDGYVSQTQAVTIAAGDDYELNVTLELIIKAMITGNVVDKNGDPIGGAKVKLKGVKTKYLQNVTLDEDGYFEFTDLEADTYILIVKAKGYKQYRKTLKVAEGEQVEDLEVVLKKVKK